LFKFTERLCAILSLLLGFLLCSPVVLRAQQPVQQTATGWLTDFNHPPISVQMLLTGESDPQLKTVNAVLQVELQEGWKTYWRSPGEGGAASQLDFSQATNIQDVVWDWPAPKRYNVLGVDTLGYKEAVNFPLTLQLADFAKPVIFKGMLTLASCSTYCVLSSYELDLQFDSNSLLIDDAAYSLYHQALAAVPSRQNQQEITVSRSSWDNNQQLLSVEFENQNGWHAPDIFVDSIASAIDGLTFSAPEFTVAGNTLITQMKVSSWADKLDLNSKPLNFTLVDGSLAVELTTVVGEQNVADLQTLTVMFAIALIGGLILNIMPCVLPVLGMKLSSILSAKGINRLQIRMQFIASSAGILSSFWLLAGFLLLLKLSGQVLGWGIQFQSPYFISAMLVVTLLFAASMLDIFTIQLPVGMQTWLATRGGHSYLGYYLQGMFATLLATPCSAPFLGTAVAFSLSASAVQLFIIFTALGLGMALPWLLIAAFPAIALCLPKPGNWMNSVKTFFALLILATSYWLLSLLSNFIGQSLTLLIALLLTALLLFLIARKRSKKLFTTVLTVIVFACAGVSTVSSLTANNNTAATELHWLALERAVIDRQVKQGKVVFVDVTADWCVTCKANKIGVLLQEPVYSKLQENGIVAMRGDWTIASERVTEYLQSYGRVAVPFNIVYGPAAPQGILLPTILTTDTVLSAIEQAK
jgi:suppressor for copper-sensitivity B